MKLYPLKFDPVFCYRVWGGDKLKTQLHKDYEEESIGESWEISAVKNMETKVANGPLKGKTLRDVLKDFGPKLVGNQVFKAFGNEFPLLIKYIDAAKPLSIQVHPSDELARERHDSFGKNEMWYIIGADDSAELVLGFQEEISPETYEELLRQNRLVEALNRQCVKRGDTFYIPTGRVHAIGAGVMLAEIQQTSDVTYRIYDYDRIDSRTGKKRELHTELAREAIDFKLPDTYQTTYHKQKNTRNKLVHSPYFKTNFLRVEGSLMLPYAELDSFVILMCVEGRAELIFEGSSHELAMGQTLLIPANADHLELRSDGSDLIEVFM